MKSAYHDVLLVSIANKYSSKNASSIGISLDSSFS